MDKVDGIWVRYETGSDAKKVVEEFKKMEYHGVNLLTKIMFNFN